MKLLFSIFFFCVITLPCLAQDSLKTASTLSFKPLVGLGLLNGARAGLQVQYNDFIAIEGGVGILNRSMFSYGVILSPFDENRLSFFYYKGHHYYQFFDTFDDSYQQIGMGWLISVGDTEKLRVSLGSQTVDIEKILFLGKLLLTLDFTVTFDGVKLHL